MEENQEHGVEKIPSRTDIWINRIFVVVMVIVMTLTAIGHIRMAMLGIPFGTPEYPVIW